MNYVRDAKGAVWEALTLSQRVTALVEGREVGLWEGEKEVQVGKPS